MNDTSTLATCLHTQCGEGASAGGFLHQVSLLMQLQRGYFLDFCFKLLVIPQFKKRWKHLDVNIPPDLKIFFKKIAPGPFISKDSSRSGLGGWWEKWCSVDGWDMLLVMLWRANVYIELSGLYSLSIQISFWWWRGLKKHQKWYQQNHQLRSKVQEPSKRHIVNT